MSKRTFKQRVHALMQTAASVQSGIQTFVCEALDHAQENDNNFENLSYLMREVIARRGFSAAKLKGYIEAVAVGIRWNKETTNKAGDVVEARFSGKVGKVDFQPLPTDSEGNTIPWYEFGTAGEVKEMKVANTIKSFIDRMTKAANGELTAKGQVRPVDRPELARQAAESVQALLA